MTKEVAVNPLYQEKLVTNGKGFHPCGKVSANSEYFRDPKNGKTISIEKDSRRNFIVSIKTTKKVKQASFKRRDLERMISAAESEGKSVVKFTIDQVPAEIEVCRIKLLLG